MVLLPFEAPEHNIKQVLESYDIKIGSEFFWEFYKDFDDNNKLTTYKSGRRFLYIAKPTAVLPKFVKVPLKAGKYAKIKLLYFQDDDDKRITNFAGYDDDNTNDEYRNNDPPPKTHIPAPKTPRSSSGPAPASKTLGHQDHNPQTFPSVPSYANVTDTSLDNSKNRVSPFSKARGIERGKTTPFESTNLPSHSSHGSRQRDPKSQTQYSHRVAENTHNHSNPMSDKSLQVSGPSSSAAPETGSTSTQVTHTSGKSLRGRGKKQTLPPAVVRPGKKLTLENKTNSSQSKPAIDKSLDSVSFDQCSQISRQCESKTDNKGARNPSPHKSLNNYVGFCNDQVYPECGQFEDFDHSDHNNSTSLQGNKDSKQMSKKCPDNTALPSQLQQVSSVEISNKNDNISQSLTPGSQVQKKKHLDSLIDWFDNFPGMNTQSSQGSSPQNASTSPNNKKSPLNLKGPGIDSLFDDTLNHSIAGIEVEASSKQAVSLSDLSMNIEAPISPLSSCSDGTEFSNKKEGKVKTDQSLIDFFNTNNLTKPKISKSNIDISSTCTLRSKKNKPSKLVAEVVVKGEKKQATLTQVIKAHRKKAFVNTDVKPLTKRPSFAKAEKPKKVSKRKNKKTNIVPPPEEFLDSPIKTKKASLDNTEVTEVEDSKG